MTGDFGRPIRPAIPVVPQKTKGTQLRIALVAVAVGLLTLVYVVQVYLGGQWAFAPLIWVYVVPGAGGAAFLALTGITWLISRFRHKTAQAAA